MDLLAIEGLLPSGFHDAYIKELKLDFIRREIQFLLDVLMGETDQPAHESYRKCRFTLHDYSVVAFEPAVAYREIKRPAGLEIDRVELKEADYRAFKAAGYTVPETNFWLALFVYEWNSRIVINARDATLEFL